MTDTLMPLDLPIASATNNLDANTSSFSSPTVGTTRTAERLGDRLRFQLQFSPASDNPSLKRQRGRLIAFIASLRGQASRVWLTPPGGKLRGSFPAIEMFTNNDFSNGTTGWSPSTQFTLSAIDGGIRANRAQVTGSGNFGQNLSLTAGVPYCARGFVSAGKGSASIQFADTVVGAFGNGASQGMLESAFTSVTGTDSILFFDPSASFAANYFDVKWSSFARCALVDNGVNLLLNSDTPGTGTGWTLSAATAASGGGNLGPDGIADAWTLTEAATTAAHFTFETTTVAAAAADFSVSWLAKANLRTWCFIEVSNGTTAIFQWFNLSTGALGSSSVGAGFTLIGAIQVDCGNGWKRCILTFRKTDASTSLNSLFCASTGDTVQSYAGNSGSVALLTWRASFAQSSVPVASIKTTSAAITGTLQTGLQLNLKGLPVSTQGLLLPGDWNECGGQLNQISSPLDSDAAGLGTAILVRPPRNSPADSAGFVVNTPMGKFMVTSNSTAWNEVPGNISDASIELAEDISF